MHATLRSIKAKAKAWTAERLVPYVDSPLSAGAGTVLIAYPG